MKKLSLFVALLGLCCSGWAQPGTTTLWPSYDSSIFLNARKLWGSAPGAATVELLSAPILSTPTGAVQVAFCDCATLGRSYVQLPLSNVMRLATVLPGWDPTLAQVSATISLTSCSNEPNDTVKFSLRAGAIANGGDISSPSFGASQTITTNIPGKYALSQSTFAPITVGNATSNSVVIFELSRLNDSYTNVISVGSLSIFYSKSFVPQ